MSFPLDESNSPASLPDCGRNINVLEDIERQIERRLSLSRSKRNYFATINFLPNEILSLIFTFAVQSALRPYNSDLPFILMSICRRWNAVVLETPALWTSILQDPNRSLHRAIQALSRSGKTPLDLSFSALAYEQQNHRFLQTILPHTARWRRLSLNNLASSSGLIALETIRAPLLEDLALAFDWEARAGEDENEDDEVKEISLNLFRGHAPRRLRHLTLSGIPLNWSPGTLRRLITLDISHLHFGAGQPNLWRILDACQNLQKFSLNRITFSDNDLDPNLYFQPPHPLHVPELQVLRLVHIHWVVIVYLLRVMHAPNCTRAQIDGTESVEEPMIAIFNPATSHFHDLMRRKHLHGRTPTSTITYHGLTGAVWEWYGPWRMTCRFDDTEHFKERFQWFTDPIKVMNGGSCEPLTVEIRFTEVERAEMVLRTLVDMDEVRTVILGPFVPALSAFHLLLGRYEESGQWFFPGLANIWIGDILRPSEVGEIGPALQL
ncbi:hypothetical protein FRB90_006336, partial [Tulasnella sp. 427]